VTALTLELEPERRQNLSLMLESLIDVLVTIVCVKVKYGVRNSGNGDDEEVL